MMLMCAFGASVGGIGTPIGTPPNLIGIGMLNRIAGTNITFFGWMILGVPIVLVLFGFLVGYFYFRSLRGLKFDTTGVGHHPGGTAPPRSDVGRAAQRRSPRSA